MIFNFLNFFLEFSWLGQVKTIENEKFFFLFFGMSWPISAWNEARIMMFNFLNFLLFYSEFPSSDWVKMFRTRKFFLPFSACLDLFLLEMKPGWCFLIFKIFMLFFLEFSSLCWVKTVSNKKLFFLFLDLSRPVSASNEAKMMFWIFWYFIRSSLARIG